MEVILLLLYHLSVCLLGDPAQRVQIEDCPCEGSDTLERGELLSLIRVSFLSDRTAQYQTKS